ncbi:hypothetical protein H9P43_007261 [Blastocladiella emersonii ATCC 22665]|nr:hypothetical protein H9P43_007261 [Blastocladiella emersonii ATCC 22665]
MKSKRRASTRSRATTADAPPPPAPSETRAADTHLPHPDDDDLFHLFGGHDDLAGGDDSPEPARRVTRRSTTAASAAEDPAAAADAIAAAAVFLEDGDGDPEPATRARPRTRTRTTTASSSGSGDSSSTATSGTTAGGTAGTGALVRVGRTAKGNRMRERTGDAQRRYLATIFSKAKRPDSEARETLGWPERSVRIWFQNMRQKEALRVKHGLELLAAPHDVDTDAVVVDATYANIHAIRAERNLPPLTDPEIRLLVARIRPSSPFDPPPAAPAPVVPATSPAPSSVVAAAPSPPQPPQTQAKSRSRRRTTSASASASAATALAAAQPPRRRRPAALSVTTTTSTSIIDPQLPTPVTAPSSPFDLVPPGTEELVPPPPPPPPQEPDRGYHSAPVPRPHHHGHGLAVGGGSGHFAPCKRTRSGRLLLSPIALHQNLHHHPHHLHQHPPALVPTLSSPFPSTTSVPTSAASHIQNLAHSVRAVAAAVASPPPPPSPALPLNLYLDVSPPQNEARYPYSITDWSYDWAALASSAAAAAATAAWSAAADAAAAAYEPAAPSWSEPSSAGPLLAPMTFTLDSAMTTLFDVQEHLGVFTPATAPNGFGAPVRFLPPDEHDGEVETVVDQGPMPHLDANDYAATSAALHGLASLLRGAVAQVASRDADD